MENKIDQKKYLQKYLNPKGKHKKKSHKKSEPKRVNIIDDDIDVSQIMPIGDSEIDIYTTGEDAPQIAGIIDERPIDVRLKEKFKFNTQWTLINQDDGFNSELIVKEKIRGANKHRTQQSDDDQKNTKSDDRSPPRHKSRIESHERRSENYDSDNSPPRQKSNKISKSKSHNSDSDASPPRKNMNSKSREDSGKENFSRKSRHRSHSIESLPGRKPSTENKSQKHGNHSRYPEKGAKRYSDSDASPPRKKTSKEYNSSQDFDTSPPRKRQTKRDKGSKHHSDLDTSSRKKPSSKQDSDTSPPRKKKFTKNEEARHSDSDNSPPRRKNATKNSHKSQSDSDADPPRKCKSGSDESPPRKPKNIESRHSRHSSPPRNMKTENRKKSRFTDSSPPRIKSEKKEAQRADTSSRNPTIVKFNIRDPDQAEKKLEAEKKKIQEEKYATWGRGLKQVEDHREKMGNDSHEMSKPLARYADDEDLESYLKDQEREGDPMLEYIRKQKKIDKDDGKPSKPRYEGAFMPNRFGIAPGYRWDGVDRSSGYEANWFNVQNSKKILEEEAYKWSTDDM